MKFSKKIGKNTVFLRKEKEMTQRVFDVENEKDMSDLWDILPDEVCKIEAGCGDVVLVYGNAFRFSIDDIFSINFHNKTEITRPTPEATEADVGKICVFWDDNPDNVGNIGTLTCISDCYSTLNGKVEFEKHRYQCGGISWKHCRRLTTKDIEELI